MNSRPQVYDENMAIAESVSSSGSRPDESDNTLDTPEFDEYLQSLLEEDADSHSLLPDYDTRWHEGYTVNDNDKCPVCGQNDVDMLIFIGADNRVECQTCHTVYKVAQ